MVALQLTLIPIHMNYSAAKVLNVSTKWQQFTAIVNINFTTLVS